MHVMNLKIMTTITVILSLDSQNFKPLRLDLLHEFLDAQVLETYDQMCLTKS